MGRQHGELTARGGGRDLGRFFLDPGGEAEEPVLAAGEMEHAQRVLRAAVGDRLLGLDGRGLRQRLVVVAVDRRSLRVAPDGPAERDPPPGAAGAPLPAIAVAVAPPRSGRVEPMLDRLTQLGVAEVRWLRCAHTGPKERTLPASRLDRILREALKQCGRTWLPQLIEPVEPAELAARNEVVLVADPAANRGWLDLLRETVDDWCRPRLWSPDSALPRPGLCLVIGPEGGFDLGERAALAAGCARVGRLGPHILRIETAAEAALAGAVLVAGGAGDWGGVG